MTKKANKRQRKWSMPSAYDSYYLTIPSCPLAPAFWRFSIVLLTLSRNFRTCNSVNVNKRFKKGKLKNKKGGKLQRLVFTTGIIATRVT